MRLTQREIAKRISKHESFISKLLSGKLRPSWKTAKSLASITKTKPEYWLEASPGEMKLLLKRT